MSGQGPPLVPAIVGVILAGGRSSRMFPGAAHPADKTLLDVAGTSMLARVIAAFAPQVRQLILNANGDASRFAAFGLPVVADTTARDTGPLAGILAGMNWARDRVPGATHIATVSGDAPFLPPDLVVRLIAGRGDSPIAIAASTSGVHPVIGLWPVSLADDLATDIASGTRTVRNWADRHGAATVMFGPTMIGDRTLDPFFNANTPADLDAARALAAVP